MLLESKQKENASSYLVEKYISPTCQKMYIRESEERCIVLEAGDFPAGEADTALQTAHSNLLAREIHKHVHTECQCFASRVVPAAKGPTVSILN